MATNLWPNQWCEASGPVIGSVAADVDAPVRGGVFKLAGRDHRPPEPFQSLPVVEGERQLVQFAARRVSGTKSLNVGTWGTSGTNTGPRDYVPATKIADLPGGGGWALYEREIQYQSGVTAGGFFFQIDQGLANGDPNGTHVWQVAGPLMWKRVADMAVKARDDVTLAALTDIANVRRYYLLQSSTLNPPAAPTANPAPAPWVTAEPTYTEGSTNSLYTVDLTAFSDGTFDYSTVSKSSSYEAAKSAYNKAASAVTLANLVEAMAKGLFVASATDPGVDQVGRVWAVLNDAQKIVGLKISDGTNWASYAMIVEDLMVVGEDGTIRLKDNTVTAGTIVATAIDGMTITGATLQTDADDSTGLKVTPLGLIAFNTDGDPSVWIGRDGTMTLGAGSLDGSALAPGTITPDAIDLDSTASALAQAGIADQLDMSNNASMSDAIDTAISPVQDQVQATAKGLAQQQAYFRFQQDRSGNPVLALGASNSPNQLKLTNTEIDLLQGGYIVSRWTSGRMEVNEMKVSSIIIGNHQLQALGNGETIVRAV